MNSKPIDSSLPIVVATEYHFSEEDAPTACQDLKKRHDECFVNWYTNHFMKHTGVPLTICEDIDKEYKRCLKAKLHALGIPEYFENPRLNPHAEDN